jgi:hypothetical protein
VVLRLLPPLPVPVVKVSLLWQPASSAELAFRVRVPLVLPVRMGSVLLEAPSAVSCAQAPLCCVRRSLPVEE